MGDCGKAVSAHRTVVVHLRTIADDEATTSATGGVVLESGPVAVLGATGVVGTELLRIISRKGILADDVLALASGGASSVPYGSGFIPVGPVEEGVFRDVRTVFMAAGAEASRVWAPIALAAGCDVIDTSSAHRMDPEVPLVIPEVNGEELDRLKASPRLVANPNCSTILLLMALTPLHRSWGCERIVVSTYQAVSGAGASAMEELRTQSRSALDGDRIVGECFDEPCAFNVFSHDSAIDESTGRNGEEQKMLQETGRIWRSDVPVSATCMRVPVLRSHTESIHVQLRGEATVEEVRSAIAAFPGVCVIDDRTANDFPTPLKASDRDLVLVGRIRMAADARLRPDGRGDRFELLCSMDQLRKGAALNAIQLAERLKSI